MEDWHPIFLVAMISIIPTIAGIIVFLLAAFRLTPVVFIPVGVAILFALQSYMYAMLKFFRERKLKKLAILAVALALVFITPYTVYAVTTPNWSFAISSDKTVYRLGENVTITVTLTNKGYVTHSFFNVGEQAWITFHVREASYEYWLGNYIILNDTESSLAPNQFIQKIVIWNQTLPHMSNHTDTPVPINQTGDYHLTAKIVNAGDDTLFYDSVKIKIYP